MRPARILPVIVVSQFAGTSLWFAVNAILPDLQKAGHSTISVGLITSAVQAGFIIGTLGFALATITDRYSPRLIFLLSCFAGAIFTLLVIPFGSQPGILLVLRFLTGIALAGIYPVGMKIAAGWYERGLGNVLGLLVGALVLGTAFPHLTRAFDAHLPWVAVILVVAGLSAFGGLLMYFLVPDGPFLIQGTPLRMGALPAIFRERDLRAIAFGYFGHMWELYTLYAFVPLALVTYSANAGASLNVPFWSFAIIAAGTVGCVAGGIVSRKSGSTPVAAVQLLISGLVCIGSPMLFGLPQGVFLFLMLIWGAAVVGDSPQYSALIAAAAPRGLVGTALTICLSIGFGITIVSIQTLAFAARYVRPEYLFLLLAPGPLFGLFSMRRQYRTGQATATDGRV